MVKLTVRDKESIQEAVRRFRKLVERSDQWRGRENDPKPQGSRIGVVGGLRHVDVVIGMKGCVIPFLFSHEFERDIGNHLVGIHVGGRSGAALNGVHHELIVKAAVLRDQIASPVDGVGLRGRQMPETPVGTSTAATTWREGGG